MSLILSSVTDLDESNNLNDSDLFLLTQNQKSMKTTYGIIKTSLRADGFGSNTETTTVKLVQGLWYGSFQLGPTLTKIMSKSDSYKVNCPCVILTTRPDYSAINGIQLSKQNYYDCTMYYNGSNSTGNYRYIMNAGDVITHTNSLNSSNVYFSPIINYSGDLDSDEASDEANDLIYSDTINALEFWNAWKSKTLGTTYHTLFDQLNITDDIKWASKTIDNEIYVNNFYFTMSKPDDIVVSLSPAPPTKITRYKLVNNTMTAYKVKDNTCNVTTTKLRFQSAFNTGYYNKLSDINVSMNICKVLKQVST